MCGILFNYGNCTSDKAGIMSSIHLMDHRGPDACKLETYGSASLGHTRLAIIDLSDRSNQPMQFKDFVIVFNGEIFNFEELRNGLVDLGYKFETSGDTEVILKLYDAYGDSIFNMLNGMWSLVIFNYKTEEYTVSRDRFGQKPLFYKLDEDNFICASELQVITSLIPSSPNVSAIRSFILEGDFDVENNTFFSNIFEFPAACFAKFHKGSLVKVTKYWDYPTTTLSHKATSGNFTALLEDSVRLRMKTDVKYCTLLSGGVDSTIISSMMKEHDHGEINSFTFSSEDKDDESYYANKIATALELNSHTVKLNDNFNLLDDRLRLIVRNLGRGHSSPAVLSVDRIYDEIKSHGFKVAIDGQGADELLGGYKWYHFYLTLDLLKQLKIHEAASVLYDAFNEGMKQVVLMTLRTQLPRHMRLKITSNREASSIFKSRTYQLEKPNIVPPKNHCSSPQTHFNKLLVKQHSAGLKNLLYYGDIVSMINSVENRSPFMDHRVVELGFKLPMNEKVKGSENKYVLKLNKHYKKFKPLLDRKKVGFNTPISSAYKKFMIDQLLNSKMFALNIFQDENFKRNLEKGIYLQRSHERILFRLYQVHLWCDIFEVN